MSLLVVSGARVTGVALAAGTAAVSSFTCARRASISLYLSVGAAVDATAAAAGALGTAVASGWDAMPGVGGGRWGGRWGMKGG